MPRELKVYGAMMGGTHRIIVAAHTKKEAYEAMSASGWGGGYKAWDQQSGQTWNAEEVRVATAKPGIVFKCGVTAHWRGNATWYQLERRHP